MPFIEIVGRMWLVDEEYWRSCLRASPFRWRPIEIGSGPLTKANHQPAFPVDPGAKHTERVKNLWHWKKVKRRKQLKRRYSTLKSNSAKARSCVSETTSPKTC